MIVFLSGEDWCSYIDQEYIGHGVSTPINFIYTCDTFTSIFERQSYSGSNKETIDSICCESLDTISYEPTNNPTFEASSNFTNIPSQDPISLTTSMIPSQKETAKPSFTGYYEPSSFPTMLATLKPSFYSSSEPSESPIIVPMEIPSLIPSQDPSLKITTIPSLQSSSQPSFSPTIFKTMKPSLNPSAQTSFPPTFVPSSIPNLIPSPWPSLTVTSKPSFHPSFNPSYSLSIVSSKMPSQVPNDKFSQTPSEKPKVHPSFRPSSEPMSSPSMNPHDIDSKIPTQNPTHQVTQHPSSHSSSYPSFYKLSETSLSPTAFLDRLTNAPSFPLNEQFNEIPSDEPSKNLADTKQSNLPLPSSMPIASLNGLTSLTPATDFLLYQPVAKHISHSPSHRSPFLTSDYQDNSTLSSQIDDDNWETISLRPQGSRNDGINKNGQKNNNTVLAAGVPMIAVLFGIICWKVRAIFNDIGATSKDDRSEEVVNPEQYEHVQIGKESTVEYVCSDQHKHLGLRPDEVKEELGFSQESSENIC